MIAVEFVQIVYYDHAAKSRQIAIAENYGYTPGNVYLATLNCEQPERYIATGDVRSITRPPRNLRAHQTPAPTQKAHSMSTSKHTPGPWITEINNPTQIIPGHSIKTEADPCVPIACVHRGGGADGVAEYIANAHLIAAAPDMFAVINSAIAQFELLEKLARGERIYEVQPTGKRKRVPLYKVVASESKATAAFLRTALAKATVPA